MIYQGTVHDGVVVLPTGVQLPEGQRVMVQALGPEHTAVEMPANWEGEMKNGVPVFPLNKDVPPPSMELINELRDSEP